MQRHAVDLQVCLVIEFLFCLLFWCRRCRRRWRPCSRHRRRQRRAWRSWSTGKVKILRRAREALAPVINAQGAAAMEEPLHAQQEWQAAAAGGAAAACRPRPVQQAAGDRALLAGLRQKLQQQAAKHAACEEALRAQLLKRNAALAEADRRFGELEGMMRRIAIHAGVPC